MIDWLDTYTNTDPVNIILLHIGTNDIDDSQIRLILLQKSKLFWIISITYESDHSVKITVILALIINHLNYTCGDGSATTHLNDAIYNMAQARIASGDRIEIVDMECGADIDYRLTSVGGDMYEQLHPYPYGTGYEKMADLWFSGLQAIQPVADAGSDQNVNEFESVTLDGYRFESDHVGAVVSISGYRPGISPSCCRTFNRPLPRFSAVRRRNIDFPADSYRCRWSGSYRYHQRNRRQPRRFRRRRWRWLLYSHCRLWLVIWSLTSKYCVIFVTDFSLPTRWARRW